MQLPRHVLAICLRAARRVRNPMCEPSAAKRARQHTQSICSKTTQARVALGCVACRCLRASCLNTSLVAATADMRQQLRSAASTLSRARRAKRRGQYHARGCFVALSAPELTGGDVLMAACFVATRCAPRPSARELGADGLEALVCSWRRDFDADAVAELHTPAAPRTAPWCCAARDFIA